MESSTDIINRESLDLLSELTTNKQLDYAKTSDILSKFRILTREKTLNSQVLDQDCINNLVKLSANYHTEAQKCISNLILNYTHMREQLINPYVECVENRLTSILNDERIDSETTSSDDKISEVLYYDLRIMFLLSALCSGSRAKIRDRLVNLILRITEKEASKFSDENHLIVFEGLKTIFNLTLDKCMDNPLAGDVITKLCAVVGFEQDEACNQSVKPEITNQLLVHLIHLLTNMPREVYLKLSERDVDKILNHLDCQLRTYSRQNFRETVLPVLNVCANICKFNEEVRKRWFNKILASADNFEKRPEEYDNLRGRLVKLMTSVDVHIKDIAAEFMHALCDEDTAKLITYTGLGNSAAFLSSRGLLSGGMKGSEPGDREVVDDGYLKLRDRIDPITGKIETPRKNPMEGMSEEEKEYHAHELADAITKLNNLGVVKPMKLDQDGKVKEVLPEDSKDGKD